MKRRHRTDQQLVEASKHVHYEFWMLRESAAIWASTEAEPVKRGLRNVGIEAFAIHARNLYEFAYGSKPKPEYIHAVDFIERWGSICPPWPFAQAFSMLGRAGREIAHLSWGRADIPNVGWPIPQVTILFAAVADVFFTNANPAHLHEQCGNPTMDPRAPLFVLQKA